MRLILKLENAVSSNSPVADETTSRDMAEACASFCGTALELGLIGRDLSLLFRAEGFDIHDDARVLTRKMRLVQQSKDDNYFAHHRLRFGGFGGIKE